MKLKNLDPSFRNNLDPGHPISFVKNDSFFTKEQLQWNAVQGLEICVQLWKSQIQTSEQNTNVALQVKCIYYNHHLLTFN